MPELSNQTRPWPMARPAILVVALVVLDASLAFKNVWPTPAIRWQGALSVELAVCVLAMALALLCWDERLVPLLSSRKRTREAEENRRKLTIQDMYSLYTERQFNDVLRRKTLDRKATLRQMKLAARLYGNRR